MEKEKLECWQAYSIVALLGGAGEALVAAQAAADLILMAALGLVGKLGVGQHLAAQDGKVDLALGNGLLAQLGGVFGLFWSSRMSFCSMST